MQNRHINLKLLAFLKEMFYKYGRYMRSDPCVTYCIVTLQYRQYWVFASMQTYFKLFKGTKMKKIISIALVAAVVGLVGCSAQDKSYVDTQDSPIAAAGHKNKCKGKKCRRGKLGAEKSEQDTAK